MAGFIAHSAHHAVLNDCGIGPADSYGSLRALRRLHKRVMDYIELVKLAWQERLVTKRSPGIAETSGDAVYRQKQGPLNASVVCGNTGCGSRPGQ